MSAVPGSYVKRKAFAPVFASDSFRVCGPSAAVTDWTSAPFRSSDSVPVPVTSTGSFAEAAATVHVAETAPDGIPPDSVRRFVLSMLNRLQILVLRTSSSLTSPSRSLHRRIMSCRKPSFMPLLIQLMIWP